MREVWGLISLLIFIGLVLFLIDPEDAANYYDWFIDRYNEMVSYSRNLD